MTTIDDPRARGDVRATEIAAPPAAAPVGNPLVLGLPTFIVGSIALGLAEVGYLPAAAAAGILPIILAATGLGLLLSTVWAAALAQSTVAGIFGVFTGFWWSYAVLVLGLNHNWWAIPAANVNKVVGLFLISWTIIVAVLTLATLRLPAAFTLLLSLVTLALLFVTIGTLAPSTFFTKAGGVLILAFAALGAYLFMGASNDALGGTAYPLGRPLQR